MPQHDDQIRRLNERMKGRSSESAEPRANVKNDPAAAFDLGFGPPDRPEPLDRIGHDLVALENELDGFDRLIRSSVARAGSPIGLAEGNLKSKIMRGMQTQQDSVASDLRDFRNQIDLAVASEMGAFLESTSFLPTEPIITCEVDDDGNEICTIEDPVGPGEPPVPGPGFPTPPTIPTPGPGDGPVPVPGGCPSGFSLASVVLPPDIISGGMAGSDDCVTGVSCRPCEGGGFECTWQRFEFTGPTGDVTSSHISTCVTSTPPTPPTIPVPLPGDGQPCIPICMPECPPVDEEEPAEEDCLEECPVKLWVNCKNGNLLILPEDEEPPEESGPWEETDERANLDDIVRQCREKDDEEDDDPEFSFPPFVPVAVCPWLPAAVKGARPFDFSEVVNMGACADRLIESEKFYPFTKPFSAFAFGELTVDACKADQAIDGILKIVGSPDCFDGGWENGARAAATIGVLNEWSGGVLEGPAIMARNSMRMSCPTEVPSLEQANLAWLTNSIDEHTWRCWVRLNNQNENNQRSIIEAVRSRLSSAELIIARRRKKIDKVTYREQMHRLGYTKAPEADLIFDLSEQVPFVSDIIRMMVRDADDAKVVDQFKLDDFFERKFGGQLQEWAESQGMPEKYMRYLWRAHWTIPPPNQLFQMNHRLTGPDVPANIRVTQDDIKEALIQQDIAPFWVDKVLALSFKLPTRRDILRMIEGDVVDQTEAIEMYLKIGFDLPDGQRLYRLAQQRVRKRVQTNSAVGAFSRGELNRAEMDEVLETQGFNTEARQLAVKAGGLKSVALRRKKCLSSIRKRFFEGEIEQASLVGEIIGQGLDNEQAVTIAEGYICERNARGKHASLSQLCLWFREGSLGAEEMFERMINLGWDRDDAVKVLRSCEIRLQKELNAEEQRRLRERLKRQRENEKAAEKTRKALERSLNKKRAGTRKRVTSMKQRRNWLLSTSENMAKKLGLSVDDLKTDVNDVYDTLKDAGLWTVNEVLQMMVSASEDATIRSVEGLLSEANNLLQTRIFPSPLDADDLPENVPASV